MKILVTTDFSANSKAGLRFAIALSEWRKTELVFFHSYFIPKPTSWSEDTYLHYTKNEEQKLLVRLNKFVSVMYKAMKLSPGKFKCVVKQSLVSESGIMEYAQSQNMDFICISTRGAGTMNKIFGTTAGNLITKSKVPVITVPQYYKRKPLSHILYASDFKNYSEELKKVIAFAKPLSATIEVLHVSYPGAKLIKASEISDSIKKEFKYNIKLHLKNTDLTQPLVTILQKAIASSRPSLVVMFTEQKRTFYQKIFLSSSSESIAFQTKVPMLVFNKAN